jgi:hypothetical protein
MKIINFFIIASLLLINSCSSNSLITSSDYQYYKTSIDFIQNDSTAIKFVTSQLPGAKINTPLCITVSPKIIPVNIAGFESFAIKHKIDFVLDNRYFSYKSPERSLTDSLLSLENALNYFPFIDRNLESISTGIDGKILLFFSYHYNNFLTAELFLRVKNDSIFDMPSFGSSLIYLFIFKDGKIDKVMTLLAYHN